VKRYQPAPPPTNPDLLAQWAFQELQRLATSLDSVTDLDIDYKAPVKPQDGMLAYADGSRWNPDATNGEGFYGYWAGTWHFLGGGGGTSSVGKHTIWVPATAMTTRTTLGANIGLTQTSNYVMLATMDFSSAQDEFVQFTVQMPKSWDESTVTARFVWSHATASTNFGVVWGLQGTAFSNADSLNAAFSGTTTVGDTGGTADVCYISDETSAITIAGTPAEGDFVTFQVYRDHDATGDTLAVDARLHGVLVVYDTNAATDD
jgi:hypothetical protein